MGKNLNLRRLLHGGDYNPEQWLDSPEILDRDLMYFKKAGINEVSMGIFSWAVLEPQEGSFHFEWMKEIIDRMYQNGISVILATPSGARPKWLADKYPEVLRMNGYRQRNLFGGRHNHCYTSPVYRDKVYEINRRLSEKFGSHPAVIAWHLSNEYSGECHCPLCQKAFQDWLHARYQTIEKLNRAWATTFWSHTYNDFSQIESPSPIGERALHGLNLDWKRFVTDRTVDFVRHEAKAVKDGGSGLPVTINMMYDYGGLNYHKFQDAVDFVSWDSYPQWHNGPESLTAIDTAMQHDIMRSILKKPFLLMESCPSATNWQPVSKLKKPGMLRAASLQAVAHGSDSVLYFQLRQSRGASEKFHGAVIDHYGGDDTRVFTEVSEVGASLEKLSCLAGSGVKAPAAVIYDWENRWALEDAAGPRNCGLDYKETVLKSYAAFRRQGLDVDVIDMEQPLDSYRVVAVPMLYMFRGGFEEKIRNFVGGGGQVILTYWSGIVDETDLCFLGGAPHGLLDVFGLRSTEIDSLYDGEYNFAAPVPGNSLQIEEQYRCQHLCDLVKTNGASVLMTYGADFYEGMPALTCNRYGAGKAYYVCADFEQSFYDFVYEKIADRAGVKKPLSGIPDGIEITTRRTRETQYLIIQNFNREKTAVAVPASEYRLIYGNYDGAVEKWDTVVFQKEEQICNSSDRSAH